MDYKEKYNAALERAKKLQETCDSTTVVGWCEYIFPELAESEDERIKREILELVSIAGNGNQFEEIKDWLEKQGKQEPISITDEWIEDYWQHEKVVNMDTYDKGEEIQFDHYGFVNFCKRYCKKPVERNEDDEKIRKILVDFFQAYREVGITIFNRIPTDNILAWLEKQGEQNFDYEHADIPQKDFAPIEPKFKVGDWVVYDHRPYQVVELPKEGYINLGLRRNEKIEFAPSPYCRHWTIADAKNGDVISYKGEISLYKHDIKNVTKKEKTFGGFVYHCCYDGKRFITDSLYSLTEQDKMDIHPATKEQRDLLFQKMADAGYEFVNGHVTRF